MKLLQKRIQQAAKDGGVGQLVVERDYAQSYVLYGIATQPELRQALVFKGGTALKKVHFKSYRFSEDLDFSAVDGPSGAVLEQAVRAAVAAAEKTARVLAPIAMVVERHQDTTSKPTPIAVPQDAHTNARGPAPAPVVADHSARPQPVHCRDSTLTALYNLGEFLAVDREKTRDYSRLCISPNQQSRRI